MSNAAHWESVYGKRDPTLQGWYTPCPQPSFEWIRSLGLGADKRILDVGGGASTLVDHLLSAGHERIAVLDLSGKALEQARERLGQQSVRVEWQQADILTAPIEASTVSVWHDRAVFHFLHDEAERQAYRAQAVRALQPGGWLILGSFRPGAPDTCSGLPVRKHTVEELSDFFGDGFRLERSAETTHVTPGGVEQAYVFLLLRRQREGSDT